MSQKNTTNNQFLVLVHADYWPIQIAYFTEDKQTAIDRAKQIAKLISSDAVASADGEKWFWKGSKLGDLAIVGVLEIDPDHLFKQASSQVYAKSKTFGDLIDNSLK